MKAQCKILSIRDEAQGVKTFEVERPDNFEFLPGQFCWISIPGYSPSPMAIASGSQEDVLRFSIRAWGDLTNALFEKSAGDLIDLDGPHGSAFPVEEVGNGTNVYLIAGGTGITPVRSVVHSITARNTLVFYGARSPSEILYNHEFDSWKANIQLTVDTSDNGWSGNVGLVTSLLEREILDIGGIFFVCGPRPMEAAVVQYLRRAGIQDHMIYVSLEKFDADGNVVGPVLPLTDDQVDF
ncbi:MAG: hypothetical protein ACXAE3_10555 [Candidatus Kariarchaeaceae archaeon]|jgi:NAD(P)H-flavin reductase